MKTLRPNPIPPFGIKKVVMGIVSGLLVASLSVVGLPSANADLLQDYIAADAAANAAEAAAQQTEVAAAVKFPEEWKVLNFASDDSYYAQARLNDAQAAVDIAEQESSTAASFLLSALIEEDQAITFAGICKNLYFENLNSFNNNQFLTNWFAAIDVYATARDVVVDARNALNDAESNFTIAQIELAASQTAVSNTLMALTAAQKPFVFLSLVWENAYALRGLADEAYILYQASLAASAQIAAAREAREAQIEDAQVNLKALIAKGGAITNQLLREVDLLGSTNQNIAAINADITLLSAEQKQDLMAIRKVVIKHATVDAIASKRTFAFSQLVETGITGPQGSVARSVIMRALRSLPGDQIDTVAKINKAITEALAAHQMRKDRIDAVSARTAARNLG